ncbi:carbohydrate ABC transporter permease [Streptomyces lonarensis]|uniref:Carbohydrate ABC transporter permease n=1 Tax=Streptomyces lonarensis TaxID=700599 RepID=A0A7X6HYN2_9ACTN|nr:carbohydrate ABC transporter permease [Streptomyces lonarensis]
MDPGGDVKTVPPATAPTPSRHRPLWRRANIPAGAGAALWLAIVLIPLYILVSATLRTREDYLERGALALPTSPSVESYRRVLAGDFLTYLLNTVVVTAACAALVVVLAVTVAYSVVRTRNAASRRVFQLFLLGLAIPSQAVIIPVYLIITELNFYDTLAAVILPTAAFALPVGVLILVGTMRDIDEETYESMALDGAGPLRTLLNLTVPMSRAGIATVGVFSALQAWNGFLFPFLLTQSRDTRVLTLGLYDYVGEFRVDVPALLAAVVLSVVPIFAAYLLARRQLVNGLMGVGGR